MAIVSLTHSLTHQFARPPSPPFSPPLSRSLLGHSLASWHHPTSLAEPIPCRDTIYNLATRHAITIPVAGSVMAHMGARNLFCGHRATAVAPSPTQPGLQPLTMSVALPTARETPFCALLRDLASLPNSDRKLYTCSCRAIPASCPSGDRNP